MKRVPDTGQTKSYTNTWGEDNDYNINPPEYLITSSGITTDTVTGLMWQREDSGELTYENALLYADTLKLGGYTDWRLPSAKESFSIINHQTSNPAHAIIYFPKTNAEYWWTADKQANDVNKIWVTNSGGGIGNHAKTETISAGGTKKYHARCVRDIFPKVEVNQRFRNHNDGTVTDNLTQLTWAVNPLFGLSWEEALSAAENLELAGYNDWRLPNIKELHSLNDEKRYGPSADKSVFPQLGITRYWSSTTLQNQATKAWFWDTQFGITTYEAKTLKYNAFVVRNADTTSTSSVHNTKLQELRIRPNPFSVSFDIEGISGDDYMIIYSSIGEIIWKGNYAQRNQLESLVSGVYILNITSMERQIFNGIIYKTY